MKYEMSVREVLECKIAVEADSVEDACSIRREIIDGFKSGKYLMPEVCTAGEPVYGYLKGVDDFRGPYSLSFGLEDPELRGVEETPVEDPAESELQKLMKKAPKMVRECVNMDAVHDLADLEKAVGDMLKIYASSKMLQERYTQANADAATKYFVKLGWKLAKGTM